MKRDLPNRDTLSLWEDGVCRALHRSGWPGRVSSSPTRRLVQPFEFVSEPQQTDCVENRAGRPDAGSSLAAMCGHVESVPVPSVLSLGKLPTVNPELESPQADREWAELFGGWIAHRPQSRSGW